MSPEELRRLFAESPMAMKARYDALSRQPGSPAMREAFLRRQGVSPRPLGTNNYATERNELDRVRQRRAEDLLADPMIGKGEMVSGAVAPEPMGEPQIRQRELAGGPSPEFLRAAGIAPEPAPPGARPAQEPAQAGPGQPTEPEQPGWFAQRRNNFDNSLSGIAAAFANNPNPSWGQIGAAMAGGAAEGRNRQNKERREEGLFGLQMEEGALNREKFGLERERIAAGEEFLKTLDPATQRMVRALGIENSGDLLMPKTEVKEVNGKLVRVGANGAEVLFDGGQEPMTPYQQAMLGVAQQRAAQAGQMTPYQEEYLRLQREKLEAEGGEAGGPFAGNGLEASLLNTAHKLNKKMRDAGGGEQGFAALSPDEQSTYQITLGQLQKAQTWFDQQAQRMVTSVPSLQGLYVPGGGGAGGLGGAPSQPPQASAPGQEQLALPGGGTVTTTQVGTPRIEPLPAEAATKLSILPGAQADGRTVSEALINKDGSVNQGNVMRTNPPGQGVPLLGRVLEGGVPGTNGRDISAAAERALDALVRLKTGAAATESEMRSMRTQYIPSPYDTPKAAKAKIDALNRDLDSAVNVYSRGRSPAAAAPTAEDLAAEAEAAAPAGDLDLDALIDDELRGIK